MGAPWEPWDRRHPAAPAALSRVRGHPAAPAALPGVRGSAATLGYVVALLKSSGHVLYPEAPVFGVKGFLGDQSTAAGSHRRLSRTIALRMVNNFRMAATWATLTAFPAARRRV